MKPAELQEVRSMPLFAGLTDAELSCLEGGEVIEVPPGTVLASEGAQNNSFHLLLAGEVRISRTYDRQSILLGVTKPGSHIGEVTILLDIPWLATARGCRSRPDCSGLIKANFGTCSLAVRQSRVKSFAPLPAGCEIWKVTRNSGKNLPPWAPWPLVWRTN